MTLVKAVFLDIDGTLMDTNYLHIEAWAQAFEEVGARPPRSSIHHEVGKGSDKLIPEFVEDEQKAERVRPWWIEGDYSYKIDRFAGPGWLLIGDALRFVDPIFSSGVDVALFLPCMHTRRSSLRGRQKTRHERSTITRGSSRPESTFGTT
jgi:hypothetical protein